QRLRSRAVRDLATTGGIRERSWIGLWISSPSGGGPASPARSRARTSPTTPHRPSRTSIGSPGGGDGPRWRVVQPSLISQTPADRGASGGLYAPSCRCRAAGGHFPIGWARRRVLINPGLLGDTSDEERDCMTALAESFPCFVERPRRGLV